MKRLAWTTLVALAAIWTPGCGSDEGGSKSGTGGNGTGGNGTSGSTSTGGSSSGDTGGTANVTGGSGNTSTGGGSNASGGSSTNTSGPCSGPTDCASSTICSPDTATCAEAQCSTTLACAEGKVCLPQRANATVGACYTTCTAFTGNECDDDSECVSFSFDNEDALCLKRGSGTNCDPDSVVSTGCTAGQVCITDPDTKAVGCHQQCDVYAEDPGCPSGTTCTVGGFCHKPELVDSGAIGEPCSATAVENEYCGDEGGRVRGACFDPGNGLTCLLYCRTSGHNDCGGGTKVCIQIYDNSPELGVCVDQGDCGNGGSGTCTACQDAALASGGCCGGLWAQCDSGSSCGKLLNCLGACADNDDACSQACGSANRDGIPAVNTLTTCLFGDEDQEYLGACGSCTP
jgi:hypothetical protein